MNDKACRHGVSYMDDCAVCESTYSFFEARFMFLMERIHDGVKVIEANSRDDWERQNKR